MLPNARNVVANPIALGCTLMANGWTDTRHRSLINFLVYCPRGMVFVKSVNASDM